MSFQDKVESFYDFKQPISVVESDYQKEKRK